MKKLFITALIIIPYVLFGQNITLKESVSKSSYPEITWFTTGNVDTLDFKVFRATIKEKLFKQIETTHFVHPFENSDTIEFVIVDTTLAQKGLYLYYIKALRDSKTVISTTAMGHNFGYITPPQLVKFKATPLTDRKAVKLDWELSYAKTVSSMTLYRSKSYDTAYTKIADISPETTTFTDVIPTANEPWFYFIVIHTYFGNNITSVRIPAFATFSEKPFKPHNIHVNYRNDSIILDWTNVGKNIIGYRVYRSVNNRPYRLIINMENGAMEKPVFADASNEVKQNTRLSYYVRNVSDGFAESNNSDTLSFYLVDHEPVLPPKEVDYIINPKGNFKFLWVSAEKGLVLAYNIYMITPEKDTVILNTKPLAQNYFTDTVYREEGRYQYQVEGIGYNDKVSKYRTTTTIYRYKPQIHVIINLSRTNKGIEVSWEKPLNPHISHVLLYKQSGNTKPILRQQFSPKDDITWTDIDVTQGKTYLYKLVAKMKNGDELNINNGVQMAY